MRAPNTHSLSLAGRTMIFQLNSVLPKDTGLKKLKNNELKLNLENENTSSKLRTELKVGQ